MKIIFIINNISSLVSKKLIFWHAVHVKTYKNLGPELGRVPMSIFRPNCNWKESLFLQQCDNDALQLCACIVMRPFLMLTMAYLIFPTRSLQINIKPVLQVKWVQKIKAISSGNVKWAQKNSIWPQMKAVNPKQNMSRFSLKNLVALGTLLHWNLKVLRAAGLI